MKFFKFAAVACLTLIAAPAMSATATTTFAVTATVQATCQISATSLAFGTYTGTQIDTTSTITATCTNIESRNRESWREGTRAPGVVSAGSGGVT